METFAFDNLTDHEQQILIDFIEQDPNEVAVDMDAVERIFNQYPELKSEIALMKQDRAHLKDLPEIPLPQNAELIQLALKTHRDQSAPPNAGRISFKAFIAYSSIAALVLITGSTLFLTIEAVMDTSRNLKSQGYADESNYALAPQEDSVVENESEKAPLSIMADDVQSETAPVEKNRGEPELKTFSNLANAPTKDQPGRILPLKPQADKAKRPVAAVSQERASGENRMHFQAGRAITGNNVTVNEGASPKQHAIESKVADQVAIQVTQDRFNNYAALLPADHAYKNVGYIQEVHLNSALDQNQILQSLTPDQPQLDITLICSDIQLAKDDLGHWMKSNQIEVKPLPGYILAAETSRTEIKEEKLAGDQAEPQLQKSRQRLATQMSEAGFVKSKSTYTDAMTQDEQIDVIDLLLNQNQISQLVSHFELRSINQNQKTSATLKSKILTGKTVAKGKKSKLDQVDESLPKQFQQPWQRILKDQLGLKIYRSIHSKPISLRIQFKSVAPK